MSTESELIVQVELGCCPMCIGVRSLRITSLILT